MINYLGIVHASIQTYVHLHTCACMHTYIHMHVCIYIHEIKKFYAVAPAHMHVHTCMYIHIRMYACKYAIIYAKQKQPRCC